MRVYEDPDPKVLYEVDIIVLIRKLFSRVRIWPSKSIPEPFLIVLFHGGGSGSEKSFLAPFKS
jgi:hypothetical protein